MKKLVSQTGCVHINNPEEPTDWPLCNNAVGSKLWSGTDAPVTCGLCLRMVTKSIKSTKVISRMAQLIATFGDCVVVGENGRPIRSIVQDIRGGETVFVVVEGDKL